MKFGFDEEIITQYTEGDCWILANALNKLYGYDRILVGFGDGLDDIKATWIHAANYLPGGLIVDIEGVHNEDDFKKKWAKSIVVHPAKIKCDQYFGVEEGRKPNTRKARRWAKKVHDKLQEIEGLKI